MTPADETVFRRQYRKSFEDIRTLKSRLPEESIVSLAREVLLRVASRLDIGAEGIAIEPERVEALARALVSPDQDAAAEIVRELRGEGATDNQVYLGFLGRASQVLGAWWEEDKVSFVDVTVGTGRIYAILRGMSDLVPEAPTVGRKSAVFSAVPHETHTLGVRMAADLLRHKGWEIDLKIGLEQQDLVDEIAAGEYAVVGLSGGGVHSVGDLARLIVALRISCPHAFILVSGNIVSEARELVDLMDVDAVSETLQEAEAEMERYWKTVGRR